LDLSYNGFERIELEKMAEELSSNRTLYGLHLEGNQPGIIVDPRGFIHVPRVS
jgi:hypothetical protein